MNTIAHAAGLICTLYLALFCFREMDEPHLGWAFIVLSVWMLGSTMLAIYHDWIIGFGGGD